MNQTSGIPGQASAAPGYWMNETSGVLVPVVEKYLRGDELSASEVATMRAYLRQWVEAFDTPGAPDEFVELRGRIDVLETRDDIRLWFGSALDLGIDPL